MNVYANLIELDDSEIMKGVVVFRNKILFPKRGRRISEHVQNHSCFLIVFLSL